MIPDISFDTDDFTDGMELSLRLEYGKNATPVSLAAAKVFLGDDMTITSSNEKVATVDANGKVVAVKDGTTVITYSSAAGDKKFTCKVEVWSVKVEGIAFKDPVFEAKASATGYSSINLGVVWTPANASNKNVTYKLSNPDVVELRDGRYFYTLKGVAGETEVTATSEDGGYTASCRLIVRMSLNKLSLDKSEATLTVGETLTLNPVYEPENTDPKFRGVIWTSSDPKVANVDENGLVTALAEGTATIQATSDQSSYKYARATVTVVKDESGIENVSTATVVKAWPNPFTDYIMVESPVAATAEVYNLQGALLISTGIEAGQNRIDTSALAPGLYLVRIGTETVKMIRK